MLNVELRILNYLYSELYYKLKILNLKLIISYFGELFKNV